MRLSVLPMFRNPRIARISSNLLLKLLVEVSRADCSTLNLQEVSGYLPITLQFQPSSRKYDKISGLTWTLLALHHFCKYVKHVNPNPNYWQTQNVAVEIFHIIFGAHVSSLFVITVQILEPIQWSYRSPQLCSPVRLERLTNIEHIVQSVWCSFFDPDLTMHYSNIGVWF